MIGSVLAAFALSACAHDPGPPPQVDMGSLPCSTAPNLADAASIAFDPKNEKPVTVTFDGSLGCVANGGQRSLYKLFLLPATDRPYIIAVTAQFWGNTILAPRVLLLDKAGAVKREASHSDFAFRAAGLTALLRSHADENFLMVSSDPAFAGQTLSRIVTATHQSTMVAGPAVVSVYTGSDTTMDVQLSATGKLIITLEALPDK